MKLDCFRHANWRLPSSRPFYRVRIPTSDDGFDPQPKPERKGYLELFTQRLMCLLLDDFEQFPVPFDRQQSGNKEHVEIGI